ncbi:MAG TPA: fumarylacetoacetate hydrolase family protein [Acidimicrobiales bacterium]|nr:fumarylacetoacetate hydrolase family protein [Acidimicrobiales bacterium]
MKLTRFRVDDRLALGAVLGDEIADLSAADSSLPADIGLLLNSGMLTSPSGRQQLAAVTERAPRLDRSEVRLEAPIACPPSFLAVGLNYMEHLRETGRDTGSRAQVPTIFNKQVTCVTGPYDPIVIPAAAPDHVDYEGELGIVIGSRCRAVPAAQAQEVVAGYLVINHVSVRDWQYATNTWTMGKGWDTHGPTGPWLVTADELLDPHQLRLRTWVDGDLRQDALTTDMIFKCWELIEYLTTAFTLLPGTIIATGTPSGVGYTRTPPALLHPGSHVEIEIEGIGRIDNPVVAELP